MLISLIVTAAGESIRFRSGKVGAKKQWLRIGEKPLWKFALDRLKEAYPFCQTIVTLHKDEVAFARKFTDAVVIEGGESRSESVKNALEVAVGEYVLISDAARVCVSLESVKRVLSDFGGFDCVVPYIKLSDTVFYKDGYLDRDSIKLIQTPQLSKKSKLLEALKLGEFTDESSAMHAFGGKIGFVEGSMESLKLTSFDDLSRLKCLEPPSSVCKVGFGSDTHRFKEGEFIPLGGVKIPFDRGFMAHSDGDVLIHSLIDALLGAAGAGDIGEWFPNSDSRYKGVDSISLLKRVKEFIIAVGFEIENIDITIVTERPKITPFKESIIQNLSVLLELPKFKINIKAKSAEKMGAIGRAEGMASYCIATLKYFDWSKKGRG